jgi:uncharacterized membrane protein YfcA
MNSILPFFLATLSGMGVGGGGLLVLYLTLAKEMPQAEAQGINLLFFLCAAAAAFAVNRKKRHFSWKNTLLLAVSGILMTIPGALLAMAMEGYLLRKVFGGLLILSGILSLFSKKS